MNFIKIHLLIFKRFKSKRVECKFGSKTESATTSSGLNLKEWNVNLFRWQQKSGQGLILI
ncbi:hypothetical protein HMPREF3100_12195 [Enterococcus sp. HMSC29A04]|nr:hypothetical protein HMPREF3001_02170 [Enterococcus sp. HMSC066C04]OFT85411.1 hypothetical protein HMPREF3100_12195 [Enterococcus sp. HMSC29A04]OFU58773.1 hypothetical protein HMPREF3128_20520 [Enterococcus sp. HMSC14A10]